MMPCQCEHKSLFNSYCNFSLCLHKTLLLNDYSLNFIYAIYVHNNIEYRFGVHLARKTVFLFPLDVFDTFLHL